MENQLKKGPGSTKAKEEVKSLANKYDDSKTYVFKIVDPRAQKSRHYGIGNRCEVYDGIRRRMMRYVPFFDSVWEDEQDPSVKVTDSDHAIHFHMGILRVDGKNKNLLEFLFNHDRFKGNPKPISGRGPIFDIDDPELEAQKRLDANTIMRDAVVAALQANEDEVKTYSYVLFGASDDSVATLKSKLAEFAKAKPAQLLKLIEDPRTKRKYLIKKGLDSGRIKIKNSTLKWGISDAEILPMNPTAEPISFIADWSLSEAGKDFADLLKRQLEE